jgi:hypothetical protein
MSHVCTRTHPHTSRTYVSHVCTRTHPHTSHTYVNHVCTRTHPHTSHTYVSHVCTRTHPHTSHTYVSHVCTRTNPKPTAKGRGGRGSDLEAELRTSRRSCAPLTSIRPTVIAGKLALACFCKQQTEGLWVGFKEWV